MLLNQADLQSQTWVKIRKHFEERLAEYRRRNDGRLSDSDTTHLRGRIAEAVYVLDLGSQDPAKPAE